MEDVYPQTGKRILDLALVVAALPWVAPVLGLLALVVWLKLGPPVFFRQRRPGYREKPFRLLKFRTMTEARDDRGRLLPDADRLPPFGKFLRSTSLDELPELVNVLRGEMSLVGPRPLLMDYLPLYSPQQHRRHEVRPGLTGWAQVNGRNATTWAERFAYDLWYVHHLSFWVDVRILALTVTTTIRREGIHQTGQATMTAFTG